MARRDLRLRGSKPDPVLVARARGMSVLCAVLLSACARPDHVVQPVSGDTPPPDRSAAGVQPVDAVQIAAGTSHTCVLFASGSVACWGGNRRRAGVAEFRRQVSRLIALSRPTRIPDLADAVELAAGGHQTCVRRRNGTVACFTENATPPFRSPVATVPGLDHVKQLAVGLEHACALREDGSVWCWGDNSAGQLGRAAGASSAHPVRVAISRVVEVRAGDWHNCARKPDGSVWCWGQGRAGQLGTSANGVTPTPVRVAVPPSIRLALGNELSCAEQASGSVWCWGTFLTGAGGPYPPTVRVQPRRQSVFGAHGPMHNAAVDIAAGGRSACLLDKHKHLTCWSFGDRADQERLLGAEDLPGRVKSVALGRDHVCALLESGRVACWGDGYAGQLGDGGVFDGSRPVRVAGLKNQTQVALGQRFTCSLGRDERVWCWGSGESGQLGNGARQNALVPHPVTGVTGARALRATRASACALLDSGSVRCWGEGPGSLSAPRPVALKGVAGAQLDALSDSTQCVADRSGTLTCWGTWKSRRVSGASVLKLPGTRVLTLGGGGSGCALDGQGSVRCWGVYPPAGPQVGDFTPRLRLTGAVALAQYDGLDDLACAARRDGTVSCWGDGNNGWRHDANWMNVGTTPVQVPGLRHVVEVAVGQQHACARHADGRVSCWGDNFAGELGRGNYLPAQGPAPVVGLSNAIAIGVGQDHSCAVRADGSVWCWGDDKSGELGNGRAGGTPALHADTPLFVQGLAAAERR